MSTELVKVSMYINEADEWHHQPLHLAVLNVLREQGMAGGTVIHGVAGFTLKGGVHTSSLVDTGGVLPLVIDFIDTEEKVLKILPRLKEMAPHRLIVRQAVIVDELP
jgi:PII-like signaling protein